MREVVLDTETTGLDPAAGHKIVEIGCVELINHLPTGATFHCYLNPERDMPAEAEAVHGLSLAFLSDKPVFAAVAEAFLAFIGNDRLIIHNADFDIKFLNWELKLVHQPPLQMDRVLDTLKMARRKFPGAQASLDALCRRFGVDLSSRDKHGALLDSELLAAVYLELIGGREPGLSLLPAQKTAPAASGSETRQTRGAPETPRPVRPPRPHAPSEAEYAAHQAFVAKLKNPLWKA